MSLSNLSIEKLGQLFPIQLTEYKSEWVNLYLAEKEEILSSLGAENIIQIDHIGSTAVHGLTAKPTIDILLQINDNTDVEAIIKIFKSIGYRLNRHPENPPPHLTFVKGYSEKGFNGQAYHVHVRFKGDWDEIVFRNCLINNPEIANEYVKLKLLLAAKYKYNREAYTEGKTEFVNKIVVSARKEF